MATPRWNDWADGVTLVLQIAVFGPLLYIIFMPWLCLALVTAGAVPFLPGFFPGNGFDRVADCFGAYGVGYCGEFGADRDTQA